METVRIGAGVHRAWAVLVASSDGSLAVLTCGDGFRSTNIAEVLIPACVTRAIIGDMGIQADLLNIIAGRKVIPAGGHNRRIIAEFNLC